jgi:hypothetical protein
MAFVSGTDGDDELYGTEEGDFIIGNNGDDILWGGTEDSPTENTGDDILVGANGDDTLYGGDGDDLLTGDGVGGGDPGSDTFGFFFTLEESADGGGDTDAPLSFEAWLQSADGGGGLGLEDLVTQADLATNYTHWLEYLVRDFLSEKFGIAADAKVELNQNDPLGTPQIEGMSQADLDAIFGDTNAIDVKTGKVVKTRYWSDLDADYDWGGDGGGTTELTSNDGNDIITDFQKAFDTIKFIVDAPDDYTGTGEDLWALFEVLEGNFSPFGDTAAHDTKISLIGDVAMSVTLQDVTFDEGDSVWNYVEFEFV